ncbi:hypothetical protein H4Q26_001923 [Puccinia striiformis f. sp. tritici PST-130]|uniref:Uncharacterized protein n=1 Tax=Puccinia striiformis f. sp. tritici PST-78 TaxID=1165861 RepID=A0A0L0V3A0_9BASI|nr:hypothetical protein H4Q26_001923 [Puccinia striiformis f. sp. tritici PST-130]KNE93790.1 hypothetical protein PSTG_12893 [Puccinia striiformis f. sp. tritici PST-78]
MDVIRGFHARSSAWNPRHCTRAVPFCHLGRQAVGHQMGYLLYVPAGRVGAGSTPPCIRALPTSSSLIGVVLQPEARGPPFFAIRARALHVKSPARPRVSHQSGVGGVHVNTDDPGRTSGLAGRASVDSSWNSSVAHVKVPRGCTTSELEKLDEYLSVFFPGNCGVGVVTVIWQEPAHAHHSEPQAVALWLILMTIIDKVV